MENKPWLPYLATEYIERIPHLNWVFEWGSGYSTLFFTKRVPYLFSVEHNPKWHGEVQDLLSPWPEYQKVHKLIEPEGGCIGSNPANPIHYKSASTELGEVNFSRYASEIDTHGKFDLILIDGMARASCLYHAASHVAEGGCIVLDNAEREYYLQNTAFLFEGWERVEFTGYGPQLDYQWKTLFLINKRRRHYE